MGTRCMDDYKISFKKIEWSTIWKDVKEFITHIDIDTVEIIVGVFVLSKEGSFSQAVSTVYDIILQKLIRNSRRKKW